MWTSIRRSAATVAAAALCTTPLIAQEKTTEQPRPASAKINDPTGQTPQPATQPGTLPAGQAARQPARQPAQVQPQGARPIQRTVNKPVVTNQSPAETDQLIAGMLALGNEEEAMLGKFATEHAKHEQVQKFAEMMNKDHSQLAKQLQKWAPDATLTSSDEQSAANEKQAHNTQVPFDHEQACKQVAARCLASSKKFLGEKKGSDFDMAYVGSQCVVHQQMIDKATVLRQYASADLRSTIDKGIESAENHLGHAKELIEKLASAEKSSEKSSK